MNILPETVFEFNFKHRKRGKEMDTKINILFYSRASKKTTDNLVPIYMRVTINGDRTLDRGNSVKGKGSGVFHK